MEPRFPQSSGFSTAEVKCYKTNFFQKEDHKLSDNSAQVDKLTHTICELNAMFYLNKKKKKMESCYQLIQIHLFCKMGKWVKVKSKNKLR